MTSVINKIIFIIREMYYLKKMYFKEIYYFKEMNFIYQCYSLRSLLGLEKVQLIKY